MNVAGTKAADGLPRRAFTAEDVRRMIDAGIIGADERIELLDAADELIPAIRSFLVSSERGASAP